MTPHRAECPSFPVSIFMAGDVQDSYSIQAPDRTVWISFREQDTRP